MRDAAHQFHDEVGPPRVGGAGVEDLGDVRMIHHRQRLPLGLEAGDDLLGVHAQLDDLERDAAADRFLLLGHVNDAAAAFADLLEQLTGPIRSPGFRWGVAIPATALLASKVSGNGSASLRLVDRPEAAMLLRDPMRWRPARSAAAVPNPGRTGSAHKARLGCRRR